MSELELTPEQDRLVMETRALAFRHLGERYPDAAVPLFVVACMGAVRDMLRDPAIARELIPLVNDELREVGLAVVKRVQ